MWSDTPCKIWTGYLNDGYPYVWIKGKPGGYRGKSVRLARLTLEEHLGRPLEKGKECCHHCDNKACYEIAHLFEGTHSRNIRDSWARGRQTRGNGWGRRKE